MHTYCGCNSINLLLGFPLLRARVICKAITHSKLLHLRCYGNTPFLPPCLYPPRHRALITFFPGTKAFLCKRGRLEFPQALARKYLNVIRGSPFVLFFFPGEINLSKVFDVFFCSSVRPHHHTVPEWSQLAKAKYFLLFSLRTQMIRAWFPQAFLIEYFASCKLF